MPTAIKDHRPHPKAGPFASPPFTDLLEVMEPIKHFFFSLADILPTTEMISGIGESLQPRAVFTVL
jgi:hypothetical protein